MKIFAYHSLICSFVRYHVLVYQACDLVHHWNKSRLSFGAADGHGPAVRTKMVSVNLFHQIQNLYLDIRMNKI